MITIDAGVDQSIYFPLGDLVAPVATVTADIGTVTLPIEQQPGGVVVRFPGLTTIGWPEATGRGTITALVDGQRREVGADDVLVLRTTQDHLEKRRAVQAAIGECVAYSQSDPTPEQAVEMTKKQAGYLAFIGQFMLDLDLV